MRQRMHAHPVRAPEVDLTDVAGLGRALDSVSPVPIDCGPEPPFGRKGLCYRRMMLPRNNNVWGSRYGSRAAEHS
jgi:hypothetical protein